MAKFLVTGEAGFIGSHLSEQLIKDGNEVIILDDFSNTIIGLKHIMVKNYNDSKNY